MLVETLVAISTMAAATEAAATVVQAPDSPVRLNSATVLTASEGPPVLLYSATNVTETAMDQFTVMAFVFDAKGVLKARQVAPARFGLDPNETKYSVMVLDGFPIEAGAIIVAGVNQAQRAGSEAWWRADVQPAAEAAVKARQP